MQAHVPGLQAAALESIQRDGAPPALIAAETRSAVALLGSTPLYMGVEAVSIPAFQLHVTPGEVRANLAVARESGAGGAVLSWDLLHMPEENLLAARAWQEEEENTF